MQLFWLKTTRIFPCFFLQFVNLFTQQQCFTKVTLKKKSTTVNTFVWRGDLGKNISFLKTKNVRSTFVPPLFHLLNWWLVRLNRSDFTDATMINQKLKKRVENVSKIFFLSLGSRNKHYRRICFFFPQKTKCVVLVERLRFHFH